MVHRKSLARNQADDFFNIYRLSKQLLVDPQQSLVFKVWHKGGTGSCLTLCYLMLPPYIV